MLKMKIVAVSAGIRGYGLAGSLYGPPDIDSMPLEKSSEAIERTVPDHMSRYF